jgi:hypothetical protein
MQANQCCSTVRASRRVRLAVTLTLLVALVAVAGVLAGCGGPKTYTDKDFGFSFQYSAPWTVSEASADDVLPGSSKAVNGVNQKGKDAGGDLVYDGFSVDVFEGGSQAEVTLEDVQAAADSVASEATAADPSVTVTEAPSATTVAGMSGFKLTITFEEQGTKVRVIQYWLLGETAVYALVTQASEETWAQNQAAFDTFLSTFTVKGSASGTTTTSAGTTGTAD